MIKFAVRVSFTITHSLIRSKIIESFNSIFDYANLSWQTNFDLVTIYDILMFLHCGYISTEELFDRRLQPFSLGNQVQYIYIVGNDLYL